MPSFVHLHNHTEFSLLDGAAKIANMTKKAADSGMSHVAITDHGNMYGVPKFVLAARKQGIKPIVGCEFYIIDGDATERDRTKKRHHQIMWARNKEGYSNLIKLCSYGYTDGYYYKPRIDKKILSEHVEGLIASTCCLASEVNQTLLKKGEVEAEKVLLYYLDLFGRENYYIEIQRHTLADMETCNEWLLRMAKKHQVKVIATNDVHYVNEEDSEAHDLLLALQTQSDYADPNRFRFTDDHNNLNPRFYFKTQNEMHGLFKDVPFALDQTVELAERCTFELNLTGDMFLPQYKVPPQFKDMDEYLAAMVWDRVPRRYPETDVIIRERIEHELKIIKQMGYAGYFLIVQSFTTVAREKGVYVGPGRGSAAGSVVAYVLGIIDIDPLTYDLLFERFLNPERVSPPDIDIDFDDEGRQQVIDYVVEEYGRKSVSQVITYGTMGAKTALRDVGRTLGIPLAEVNRITKLIPDRPGVTFDKALNGDKNPDTHEELGKLFKSNDPMIHKMMRFAKTLEGTARHTGVHACAVIIAPGDITNFVPISKAKDDAFVTQYDGPMAEMCGLLKMDFLGLRTLSIIKTSIALVKENKGIVVDPDKISLEDPETYALYQRGETVATFQFESDGMRKYLRQLKPTNIEDLIAMNALYRPGPMDNIPSFVRRKHGQEPIQYPHEMLEAILKNTYGIMVYQEQIMQIAQKMGGYTLGGADLLRRAMGKKKMDVMKQERVNFNEGALKLGVTHEVSDSVFSLMEKFASYGFNKSHSAAYSVLAFKTAYMKAHYPKEYMAAVLTHNVNDIKKITFFIEECRRMGIKVLAPDVNESFRLFSVNKKGELRFGLSAIKGVGSGIVEELIKERNENGPYTGIFDFTTRLAAHGLNRKTVESLVYGGGFDIFDVARYRYFLDSDGKGEMSVLDRSIQYGKKVHAEKNSMQMSLFGESGGGGGLEEPTIPIGTTREDGQGVREAWSKLQELKFEKDVIGFYLSGHPLDRYKWQIDTFCAAISDIENFKNREVKIAGIVTKMQERTSKRGSKFMLFTLEDFTGSADLALFGDQYMQFRNFIQPDEMLMLTGRYQPRWNDEDQFELRVGQCNLLSEELFDKLVKHLQIDIDCQNFNAETLDKLKNLIDQNLGTFPLRFRLNDPKFGLVELISDGTRVKPSGKMIVELENMGLSADLGKA